MPQQKKTFHYGQNIGETVMSKQKKTFHDEYDRLFIKPTLQKVKKTSAKNNKRGYQHQKKVNQIGSWLIVFVVILFLLSLKPWKWLATSSGASGEYLDIYPLQDVNLKVTGEQNLTTPLVVTQESHTFLTSKGYQIEVTGDADFERGDSELSLLPTQEDYPDERTVATLSFYEGDYYQGSATITMSANLLKSTEFYLEKGNGSFAKAYPQADLADDIQTGYILEYDVSDAYIFPDIYQYYLFSDGTGLRIEVTPDEDEAKLTKASDLTAVKKAYPSAFTSLKENFRFVKTTVAK